MAEKIIVMKLEKKVVMVKLKEEKEARYFLKELVDRTKEMEKRYNDPYR